MKTGRIADERCVYAFNSGGKANPFVPIFGKTLSLSISSETFTVALAYRVILVNASPEYAEDAD